MSIQDDAFDIQRKLDRYEDSDYIHAAWKHFRDWAYALEEENNRLRVNLNCWTKVMGTRQQCICGAWLKTTKTIFCAKCKKLKKDIFGYPIRKR